MDQAALERAAPAPCARAVEAALEGRRLARDQALALADARGAEHPALWAAAAVLRDRGRPPVVTYSRKVFIPLTNLCRDVCSYCTFAHADDDPRAHTMSPDEVLAVAEAGPAARLQGGALHPGRPPRGALREPPAGAAALRPRDDPVLPGGHVPRWCSRRPACCPTPTPASSAGASCAELREVSASQGMMLESVSERLCGPGGPHEHAPDKRPATRLAMIRRAGELRIPFTSGILIGIGETARERVEALLALRDLHEAHGHIQEVIVQNFRAKPDTPMAAAGEPGLVELMSACAIARLVMGPAMSVQAPPNLSADYGPLLLSGINDWGGVSPLTPDFVNPEAPWPDIGQARAALRRRRLRPARAAHDLPRVPGRRRLPRPGRARPGARPGRRATASRATRRPGRWWRWPRERHLLPHACRRARRRARARVGEAAGSTTPPSRRALEAGLLPVETARADSPGARLGGRPGGGHGAARRAGVAGWRITRAPRRRPRRRPRRARPHRRRLPAHRPAAPARRRSSSAGCRASRRASRWSVDSLEEALDAIAAGAVDLVVGDWDPERGRAPCATRSPRARSSSAPPCRPRPRSTTPAQTWRAPCSPPGWRQIDGSGAARPRYTWAPGRDEEPPVPARRLSAEWEDAAWREGEPEEGLGRLDPDLAGILERSLAGHARRGWPRSSASSAPAAPRSRRSRGSPTPCARAAAATR